MLRTSTVTGDLTRCTATRLAWLIATGEVSSTDAVEAHIRRLSAIQPTVNGMSVTRFDEAREEAGRADKLRFDGAELGPLHGVPITVKDAFALSGTSASIGLTHTRDEVAAEDAPLVHRLRQAGAVVLGKTNVPQLMFSHECRNPVHGRTNNPWQSERSPGGSSGGEAAVVAAGGSPLGLGSDLGGSIRVPCHFCGVAGLKPTSGRLTKCGNFRTLRGLTAISFQPGPIARSVEDLDLAMQVLTQATGGQLDYDALPSRIDDYRKIDVSGLRVGLFSNHSFFSVSPPVVEAVELAAQSLSAIGVDVVPFEPVDFEAAIGCYLQVMTADGGADLRRVLRGSEVSPGIGKTLRLSRLPQMFRQPLAHMLAGVGQSSWSFALRHSGPRSADAAWKSAHFRRVYTGQVVAQMRQQGLDAIVMPPHALPALRHGQAVDLILAACYSFWTNLIEMPAGTVPVRTIHGNDVLTVRTPGVDVVQRAARLAESDSLGLPLGVQVVAPHWREDVVLAVMAAIEAAADFDNTRTTEMHR